MVYIFVVIVVLLFLWRVERTGNNKAKKQAAFIAYLLLLCFIGLRGHLYSDFVVYYYFFEALNPLSGIIENLTTALYEPGFVIYSTIIKSLFPNYHFWIFVNTALDLLVFFWFFKRYTGSYILPCLFFIAFNGLFWECNLYRNIKGLEFFLLSLPSLEQNNHKKFIILNLLGISFHLSSFIYLLLWPIYKAKINNKKIIFFAIIANCIYLFKVPLLGSFFSFFGRFDIFFFISEYARFADDSHLVEYGLSFGYFERLFTFVLFLSCRSCLISRDPRYAIIYNCYFVYYFLFLLFYESFTMVQRGPLMFNFSIWVIYPSIYLLLSEKSTRTDEGVCFEQYRNKTLLFTNKGFTRALVVVLLTMEFYVLSGDFKDYDNLLWGIESYEVRRSKTIDVLDERGF